MVDFDAMLATSNQPDPIEPRELYAQLNKVPGYGKLWDVQGQVLERWHDRRDERDTVIKVNTGGGKTIVGLVILQSYLNEGLGPCLYVAPNKQLAKQVVAEALQIGLSATTNVDGTPYLSGNSIGIINASELINGRTKFSGTRRSLPPVPVGAIVIDDTHAAINTAHDQLSLKLPRTSKGYTTLLDLFADTLKSQSKNSYLDLVEERRGEVMAVPFWAWREKLDEVVQILRSEARESCPLFYSWPGVSEVIHLCRAVFSDSEVTVTPFCPPIDHVTGFFEADRRVFLTATLADDSVLVTDFDVAPESAATPVTPISAGDIGERMIIAPQEVNPSLDLADVRKNISELSADYNTVVIVPSQASFKKWERWADIMAVGDDVDRAVEKLNSKEHVGLAVFANRYDGIDLPDDACRILVLDGLPEAFSPEERYKSKELSGSGADARQVQRIEQGMGRGVRSSEDHCVVFLLGPRLARLTVEARSLEQFSPATRAQIALSRRVAAQMDQLPMDRILSTARQALNRDPGWVTLALRQLRDIAPVRGVVSPAATPERTAFDVAARGDYAGAVAALDHAAEAESDVALSGLLLERKAAYADLFDPVRGQQILGHARQLNRNVLRPTVGATYVPLEDLSVQAANCSQRLAARFSQPAALGLAFESIIEDLRFDPDRVEQFEEAMRVAADLIGLGSHRPESDQGSGPDNLWALGGNAFWVIEAKSGATSNAIGKRDVAQLGQAMEWFEARYDRAAVPVPVMVHRATQVYRDATPLEGMRIITMRKLGEFCSCLRNFSRAVSAADWANSHEVERLLRGHKLDSAQLLSAITVAQSGVKN